MRCLKAESRTITGETIPGYITVEFSVAGIDLKLPSPKNRLAARILPVCPASMPSECCILRVYKIDMYLAAVSHRADAVDLSEEPVEMTKVIDAAVERDLRNRCV